MVVEPATVEEAATAEVLGSLADATRYTSSSALAQTAALGIGLGADRGLVVVTTSLEELTLDTLVEQERHRETTTVIGLGGGTAIDTAKYVGLRSGKDVVVIPTALASLAPFTTEIARRLRRQISWLGDVTPRVVIDLALLSGAPAHLNRAGAAEIVSSLSAVWDWRLADARDIGLPVAARLVHRAEALRAELADAAGEIRRGTPEGLRLLAGLLAELGATVTDGGHRRLVGGSEHTFTQAFEHRLGRLPSYGAMVGMGTVAMTALQAWFGLSAGGPVDPQDAVDLLAACGVAANPYQLGVDEGTFRGVLRHTVRFAVGESLPYSVLNEADVNYSAAEEMWRWAWRVPQIA